MASSVAEQLTAQFYQWEQRGRGWLVYEQPVVLEPPFEPFVFHAPTAEYIDDGKRHSLLSYLTESLAKAFLPSTNLADVQTEPAPLQALPFSSDDSLQSFVVSLPKGYKVRTQTSEQLLFMFGFCKYPVSFEIVASYTTIQIQFVCRESDELYLVSQLKAYFPEATIQKKNDVVFSIIPTNSVSAIIDYGLTEEFTRPFAMAKSFDLDPLTGLFGILEHIGPGEQAALQILFEGAVNPWTESIMRSVMDNQGGSFFRDAPEMLSLAQEKVSSPLYTVVIRAIGTSYSEERANTLARAVGTAISQISYSPSNVLQPLFGVNEELHRLNVLLRKSCRTGMILNTQELSTFVHFPSASVVSSKLQRNIKKTKAAPAIAEHHDFVLGTNIHEGNAKQVSISKEQRLRHTHIIGATGTGKSTLLLNLIAQDIQQGNGLAVLDPHGDLIESVLNRIPEFRYNDVIVVDPSDSSFPVAFNILSAHSEIEKDILSSDLVAVFRRLSTSWGDQMNSVFANAILAFLESNQGGTLMDLRSFLIEKSFRDEYLKTVTDPHIVYYWQKEFPHLKTGSIGSILTRLDSFLRPKLIRNMVGQKKSLDFENILDTKKILLVKLSQGLIGDENSYLLGSFFVTKMYQAAMARQAKDKNLRNDFYLYIDEFQNFITPSMSSILSGARKYHLGLTLVHQDMQQLVKQDTELASSVTSNAGTRICFRVGDTDAKRFENGFSHFDASDLQNLETGEAIIRIDKPEFDFNLTTSQLPEPPKSESEFIISLSRKKYGTPLSEVEHSLNYLRQENNSENQTIETPAILVETKKEPTKVQTVQPVELHDTDTKRQLVKQKELSEHRYLQMLIKRMAEARGYTATLEVPTPDGKGRVDVILERHGKKIACEIGVTTSKKWEVHNIEKCLNAGYELIVAVSNTKDGIAAMRKQVAEKLNADLREKILIMEPEALFSYLDMEIAKEATTETRIKGYRVKVEYDVVSEDIMKQKRGAISKTLLDSQKRNNKLE